MFGHEKCVAMRSTIIRKHFHTPADPHPRVESGRTTAWPAEVGEVSLARDRSAGNCTQRALAKVYGRDI